MVFLIQIKEKKMKKNFLKIAALLIAAMLLVVSCSQEVKAPETEDNGLVEAKLNIAFGRDLSVNGDSKAEDFYLEYTTRILWSDGSADDGYTEGVVGGEPTGKKLEADGKLGWLTPGYWEITVNAYESNDQGQKVGNKAIFTGTTSAYFTSKIATATIYLAPAKANNNSIEFDFFMQDLGETYGEKTVTNADFVVKYTISMNGTPLLNHKDVAFSADEAKKVYKTTTGELKLEAEGNTYDNQRRYQKVVTVPESGYYTVTVAVYEVKNGQETLKGGVTKGMLLAGNQAKVSGHIEPADYVGSSVNAYFIDVDTELTKTIGNYSDGKVTVTYTLTDNTDTTKYGAGLDGITRTYIWDIDGVSSQKANPTLVNKQITEAKDYEIPGVKNASCTTIYSKTVGGKTYFWAETKSVQAKVPTTGFTYTN